MGDRLTRHVGREERGVLAALRDHGDFVDAGAPDFDRRVLALLDALSEHIDMENLGVVPVAVVTLGARGWEIVGAAHDAEPSFLADPVTA